MVKHARLAGLVLTPPLSEDPKVLSALDAIGANYVRIMAGDRVKADTGLAVLVNDRSAPWPLPNILSISGIGRSPFSAATIITNPPRSVSKVIVRP